jgi:hypothetical protein
MRTKESSKRRSHGNRLHNRIRIKMQLLAGEYCNLKHHRRKLRVVKFLVPKWQIVTKRTVTNRMSN